MSLPTRRRDLWFEDGNIVLIAGKVAFKVHKGQLARQARIFKDMFAVPQPVDGTADIFDGSPSVRLYDSAPDLAYFLEALYDGYQYVSSYL